MGNLLGAKPKDVKEVLRENDRMIKRAVRELDREITSQEREQAKIAAEIKKHAKNGQVASAKSLAKSYVRTKNFITKFIMMKTQLKGISLQMQTVKSSHAMGEAMKGVTTALQKVNKIQNLPELNKIMADFMRENDIQQTVQEEMGDALDDALMQDGTEEEEAAVLNQVMDELGIDFAASLPGAASGQVGSNTTLAETQQPMAMGATSASGGTGATTTLPPPVAGGGGGDVSLDDIEERLRNLRK